MRLLRLITTGEVISRHGAVMVAVIGVLVRVSLQGRKFPLRGIRCLGRQTIAVL